MANVENKTRPTKKSVAAFIAAIPDPGQKADSKVLIKLMQEVTGEKAVMWGSAIVGFGNYHYTYESGREGDSGLVGFSPRKGIMTIYIVPGFSKYQALLKKLGKHKTSLACLYVKRLSDIHMLTLRKLIETSVRDTRKKYKV